MGWKTKLIKTAALYYAPAKLLSWGVDSLKKEVMTEAYKYKHKIKLFLILGFMFFLTIIFLSLSLALLLNSLLENPIIGYVMIGALYFMLFLILAYQNRMYIFDDAPDANVYKGEDN